MGVLAAVTLDEIARRNRRAAAAEMADRADRSWIAAPINNLDLHFWLGLADAFGVLRHVDRAEEADPAGCSAAISLEEIRGDPLHYRALLVGEQWQARRIHGAHAREQEAGPVCERQEGSAHPRGHHEQGLVPRPDHADQVWRPLEFRHENQRLPEKYGTDRVIAERGKAEARQHGLLPGATEAVGGVGMGGWGEG